MAIIQRADLVERIRRAFGLREAGVGSTVSPEIVPVVLLEDLTGPAIDEGFPRNCGASVAAGPSAGVFAEVYLINPASSRVDIVLEEIWTFRTAGEITMRTGTIPNLNNLLGTQTFVFNMDLRVQLRPNAQIDSRNQAAVVTGDNLWTINTPASAYLPIPMAITIPPGRWVGLVPTANNIGCSGIFFFTERLRTTT